jgi:hypothetical protein
MMIKLGFRRNLSWPFSRYHPKICIEEVRKVTRKSQSAQAAKPSGILTDLSQIHILGIEACS